MLVIDDPNSLEQESQDLGQGDAIVILNKIDLLPGFAHGRNVDYAVSCSTGQGIAELVKGIVARLRSKYSPEAPPVIVRERQQELIQVLRFPPQLDYFRKSEELHNIQLNWSLFSECAAKYRPVSGGRILRGRCRLR